MRTNPTSPRFPDFGEPVAKELRYTISYVVLGWVGIIGSSQGLLRLTLPQPSAEEVRQLLGDSLNCARASPDLFADLLARLQAYFCGQMVNFAEPVDLSAASVFQRRVWEATRLIPYGETRSYRWVAGQIKQPAAARAVGQALGRNPLPILIPCHRVVTTSGKLGGYRGGWARKQYLLRLESPTRALSYEDGK